MLLLNGFIIAMFFGSHALHTDKVCASRCAKCLNRYTSLDLLTTQYTLKYVTVYVLKEHKARCYGRYIWVTQSTKQKMYKLLQKSH